MGEINAYRSLIGKPEWKRQLGSPGRRWEDNTTRIDIRKINFERVDWIHLALDRDQ
jgi:hypothetical protein